MHQFAVCRTEFEHYVLVALVRLEKRAFKFSLAHVLVKHLDQQNAVSMSKARFPESLQAVPAGVIGSGEFDIVRRRLTSNAALITHRLHNALSISEIITGA